MILKIALRNVKNKTINKYIIIGLLLINILLAVTLSIVFSMNSTISSLNQMRNMVVKSKAQVTGINVEDIKNEDFVQDAFLLYSLSTSGVGYEMELNSQIYDVSKGVDSIINAQVAHTDIPFEKLEYELIKGNYDISNNEIIINEELYKMLPSDCLNENITIKYKGFNTLNSEYFIKNLVIKGVYKGEDYPNLIIKNSEYINDYIPNYDSLRRIYQSSILIVFFKEINSSIKCNEYLNEKYNLNLELMDQEIVSLCMELELYIDVLTVVMSVIGALLVFSIIVLLLYFQYMNKNNNKNQNYIYKINGLKNKYIVKIRLIEITINCIIAFLGSLFFSIIFNVLFLNLLKKKYLTYLNYDFKYIFYQFIIDVVICFVLCFVSVCSKNGISIRNKNLI